MQGQRSNKTRNASIRKGREPPGDETKTGAVVGEIIRECEHCKSPSRGAGEKRRGNFLVGKGRGEKHLGEARPGVRQEGESSNRGHARDAWRGGVTQEEASLADE